MQTDPVAGRADVDDHRPPSALADDEGPIPTFPPRRLDARGKLVPISAEESKARTRAAIRLLRTFDLMKDDPAPASAEDMMRGIDANRPDGAKLFEGMY